MRFFGAADGFSSSLSFCRWNCRSCFDSGEIEGPSLPLSILPKGVDLHLCGGGSRGMALAPGNRFNLYENNFRQAEAYRRAVVAPPRDRGGPFRNCSGRGQSSVKLPLKQAQRSGTGSEPDVSYLVLADGKMVGQIFRSIAMKQDAWKWTMDSAFQAGCEGPHDGYAISREAAQSAFRQARERMKP